MLRRFPVRSAARQLRNLQGTSLVLSLVWLLASISIAWAEFPLAAGDVVELYVARVPELNRRTTVKSDGSISFPLLGKLNIAGLSPAQMEAKVQAALNAKVFYRRSPDGRNAEIVITPEEVTATVVEYRPIYITGDVVKPGEYPYRPLMTALQAISLAGGFNTFRGRLDPLVEMTDMRSDIESTRVALAREQARIWRIGIELGEKPEGDTLQADAQVNSAIIDHVVKVEKEQLAASRADQHREKSYFEQSIKLNEEQIRILTEQEKEEGEGLAADQAELRKMQDLYAKGGVNNLRLTDARRAVMLSASRKLQTSAQLLQVRRQRDELAKQLTAVDETHKLALIKELQEATVRLAGLRAKLKAASDRFEYARGRTVSGEASYLPELSIVRKGPKGSERLPANDSIELQPGDVVDVVLRSDGQALSGSIASVGVEPTVPVK
jgi:polysaccharide biosynthesis/export protein